MADTILYALIIYGVGCIIPTPLDQQQSPPNHSPVLRTDKADPAFGPIAHTQNEAFELHVGAEDPDAEDTLRARLFFRDSNGHLLYVSGSEKSGLPDGIDPTLRVVTFDSQALCFGRSGELLLYVVVADRPFSVTDPSQVVLGGLTDSNHWELTCQ